MSEEISFEDSKPIKDFDGDFVEFTGTKGGQSLKFRVSREALDALAAEPMPTGALLERFDDMKKRIWEIARRKSDAVGGGHSGVILIRDVDI